MIEVECLNCGADIIPDPTKTEQRCDTCEEHHLGLCGEDCPVTEHNE